MTSRPLVVLLDVTERCNLRCVMCHFSTIERIRFPPVNLEPDDHGNMPVALFERVAAEFFPRAYRVALGCAAEPLMHPRFAELVTIAGRYGVPDLWFPTNLLPLTEQTAAAIVRGNVTTVAVSIDGVRKATYEKIRAGATWERLQQKLQLLRDVRGRRTTPKLRVIFTWMQSNRAELYELPAFAADLGARELDVRHVSPTDGVDVSREMLHGDELRGELRDVAHDAVRRGLKLISYPLFDERPAAFFPRLKRRIWRMRAGLERLEHFAIARRERALGCRQPDWMYVIRPSGAVFPCVYFDEPLGFAQERGFEQIAQGSTLARLKEGLRCNAPVGACATCGERRNAFYRTQ